MQDALSIAATGMVAHQRAVDGVANNLANLNTAGYKRTVLSFSDLVTGRISAANPGGAADVSALPDAGVASGVSVRSIGRSFEAGELKKTDSSMDIAVDGLGFIEVVTEDAGRAFFRGGSLVVNADGMLATASGLILKPGIRVPDDLQSLSIQTDGRVLAQGHLQSRPVELGQLEMARFASTENLESIGNGVYVSNSGAEPVTARAGQEGVGSLKQGYLEGSNVKLMDEMVQLMVAQRAYEANVKVLQAADEMLVMVNNLRK